MEWVKQVYSFLMKHRFFHNELWRYACLMGSLLVGLAAGRLAKHFIHARAAKWKEDERWRLSGMTLDSTAGPAYLFLTVVGLGVGLAFLSMPDHVRSSSETLVSVLYALAVALFVYRLVDIVDHLLRKRAERTQNKFDDMLAPLVRKSLRITLVVIVGLLIIETIYDKPVGTLLASLGVASLAIALAAQDTLKNFFGSVMILIDKPFQVGDRIIVGGHDGPVEEVGFRSTKIRTLEGHLVTVPNDQIANEKVLNIGKRPHIRRLTNITITYDTPPEKAARAVEIVREILTGHEGFHPDWPRRVYFNEFNNASLNLLVIYWYHPPDYWDFLEMSQRVNLEILRRFNEEGIEFAFPTQTLLLDNHNENSLALRVLNPEGEAVGG